MKNFLLVFRVDLNAPQRTQEQAQTNMQQWMDWISKLAAGNNLVDSGQRLYPHGKVVRPQHIVTDGPYMELKEAVGGFTIIKASSLEEAVELTRECPVFAGGGNVEVREIWAI
ncbi:YciI family protein [Chitinophaga solisilvae]|uniref:YciI family protein n=1 Tax=Chitinophaga solisilvae TaxID=1233460 RepID=UPI001367CF4D|nr:YciI family protein [Chitinophaga solisilvae]